MNILNFDRLERIGTKAFRRSKPYPWANPEHAINGDAYRYLISHLPPVTLFEKNFGYERKNGQKDHDRFTLEYDESLDIDPAWHAFIAELKGPRYLRFLRSLYGFRPLKLVFHWHYTPSSCVVSPHCDSRGKLGSHIFYLNTDSDWKAEWGGQTLVLDDQGKIDCESAPEFDEFTNITAAEAIGNRSLIFMRTPHSWHGVKAINCPDGALRKVFIVVVRRVRLVKVVRNYLRNTIFKRSA